MRLKIAITLFAAASVSSAAFAEPKALDNVERHALMLRYAACVAKREPVAVRRFLFERATIADRGELAGLVSKACVVEAGARDFRLFRAQGAALAGAWGELALGKVPARVETRFANVPALTHARERNMAEFTAKGPLSREQFAGLVESSNRDRAVMLLGECVVRAAPAASRAFVATPFGDVAAEKAAVAPLGPALTGCVNGGTVKLLPQQLRGALAFNYLRLAVAADPSLKDGLF